MSEQIINLLITGTLDTLQMTIISTVMAMLAWYSSRCYFGSNL